MIHNAEPPPYFRGDSSSIPLRRQRLLTEVDDVVVDQQEAVGELYTKFSGRAGDGALIDRMK